MFFGKFVDEVRAAVPIKVAVEKRHKLKKVSAHEWAAIDNPSLKINDQKNVWSDFGNGGSRGGDVIAYWQHEYGTTFEVAVEELAKIGGLQLPAGARKNGNGGQAAPEHRPEPQANYTRTQTTKRETTQVYPYRDAEGLVIYEVCRQEWFEDGVPKKSFFQRRPGPDGHAWGLAGGTYLKASNGEWYQATEDRLRKWGRNAERTELPEVAHTLYRFDELLVETRPDPEDPDFRPLIFLPEGEKDCETLREWGLFATTNSGGANNWNATLAEYLRDQDVVILLDNDLTGRQRGHAIAASLRPIAKRVRVLSWPEHWPECGDKQDVTDWRDKAGGDRDKLFRIIDKLPTWTPQPPDSHFNALRWVDIDKPGKELEWLIKGVLTRGEVSIWFGPPMSGKSFLILDAAMAVARGIPWMGHRAMTGLVIYQAGEGAPGLKRRLRAYRKHHNVQDHEAVPFVLLQSRIDLFSNDEDLTKLIAEIKGWATYYDHKLELVIIDTFNAAAPGAEENSSKDMGATLVRARRIATECLCHVAMVDHTPKDGSSPRGWSGKIGNVENMIAVRTLEVSGDDKRRRIIHEWSIAKQKDGETGEKRQFSLPVIELGLDKEGDKITSCVVAPIEGILSAIGEKPLVRRPCPDGYLDLLPANEDIFRCLVSALHDKGRPPPPELKRVPPATNVVTIAEWRQELTDLSVGHEEITVTLRERIRKRIERAAKGWLPPPRGKVGIIDKEGEYVWRTGRMVHPIDAPPRTVPVEQEPILAPGESRADLSF